jgi:hypothetical protein
MHGNETKTDRAAGKQRRSRRRRDRRQKLGGHTWTPRARAGAKPDTRPLRPGTRRRPAGRGSTDGTCVRLPDELWRARLAPARYPRPALPVMSCPATATTVVPSHQQFRPAGDRASCERVAHGLNFGCFLRHRAGKRVVRLCRSCSVRARISSSSS